MGNRQEKGLWPADHKRIDPGIILLTRDPYSREWSEKLNRILDAPFDICVLDEGRRARGLKSRYKKGYFIFEGYDTSVRHPAKKLFISCVEVFLRYCCEELTVIVEDDPLRLDGFQKELEKSGLAERVRVSSMTEYHSH